MADVAARAGVSVATVSRALRASPLVSAETAVRVQRAATELGFAVSRAASSLATGRQGRVAVLLGGRIGSWFNATALDGLYTGFRSAGLDLSLFRVVDAADRAEFFDRLPARRNADALVVASFTLDRQEHERLDRLGMPLVYLNQRFPGAAAVAVNDRAGAALATRYLIGLGHRSLAFCGIGQHPGLMWSAVERADGFRAELVAAGSATRGGPDGPTVVLTAAGEPPDDVVARLLTVRPRPTAVVAESDEIAFALLPALARAGLRVPADVSVIGFDDHALAGTYDLTTVAQPVSAMAEQAAGLVVELIDGAEPRVITVPTRVVVRRTTGPLPSG